MEFINSFLTMLSGLGKYLMVPLMIALIGIGFRCNPNKAIKGGITVGIGLFGLDLALSLVTKYLGPVATALVGLANLQLDVIDVGWTALSGIAYATEVGAFIIPFMLLANIVMLLIGATKTMDIDIWNYWHFALTGSLIGLYTGNTLFGFLAALGHAVIIFAIADRTAERCQEVIGIPGISIPHGGCLGQWVIGFPMEFVYNKVLGNKDNKEADAASVKKLNDNPVVAVIKDPIYVGFILGTVLGFVSGVSAKDAFTTGMAMAALLYLTPRMVKILMEGLVPISQACQKIMSKRYKGEQLYIGMDNAVGLGHSTVMLGTVLMIPVCVLLCAIVPGNRIIPMASLAACGYNCSMINVVHKGKVGRTMLTCTIFIAVTLIIASYMAPEVTKVALGTGFETEYTLISAISGTLFSTVIFYLLFQISPIVGAAATAAIIVGIVLVQIRYFKKKRELNTVEFKDADKSSYVG